MAYLGWLPSARVGTSRLLHALLFGRGWLEIVRKFLAERRQGVIQAEAGEAARDN
jgi:hypothetical protein